MSNRIDTDTLAELINQKHDMLAQLCELSRRQLEVIAQADLSNLLGVLACKQRLLNQLQEIEQELNPFREGDPEGRIWRSADDRRRCRQTAERCAALLREIMVVEKRSEVDLVHLRDQTVSQLQSIHSASEARTAYTQSSPQNSGSLDLTSQS